MSIAGLLEEVAGTNEGSDCLAELADPDEGIAEVVLRCAFAVTVARLLEEGAGAGIGGDRFA
jgi:hypothetical protein